MNEPIDDRLPFAVLMPEAAGQVINGPGRSGLSTLRRRFQQTTGIIG